jgi:4-amino-4-deoxy-L-arabinose transferase-like glycosyltransferase
MAIPVRIFGQTRFAVRLITALAGLVSLPVVYLLARRMFDHQIALISTLLMAVTHIYIQFSRVSPTAGSLDPLFSALSFYLVYRALQTRRLFDWALSGVVMGLALYFYVGARAIVLVFACSMLLIAIFRGRVLRDNWRGLLGATGAYLVTAAPMLVWAVTNPDIFNTRINQLGIFNNGWLVSEMSRQGMSALTILLEQLVDSLLIFNFHFARWFYDATVPMLGPLTGLLLAFGLLAALPRRQSRQPRFILLNCWFWVTLIAGQVLVVDPPPSGYRTLGLLPAVCILAALALTCLAQALTARWRTPRAAKAATFLIILALLGETAWNVHYYFGVWAPEQLYSDTNSRRASLIGDYLGKQLPGTLAYIASSPDFSSQGWSNLQFLSGATPYQDVAKPMAEFLPEIAPASHYVFVFPPLRGDELPAVEKAFPGGKRYEQYLGRDLYFVAYQK